MSWLHLATLGLLAGAAGLLWRGLRDRDWHVDLAEQRQLQQVMGSAVAALVAAQALRPYGPWALGAGAIAAAWIPARVCQHPPVARRLVSLCDGDRRLARSAGWVVVAAAAVWGPPLVGSGGERVLLTLRGGVGGVALLLIAQNGRDARIERSDPRGETVEDGTPDPCTTQSTAPSSTDG